MPGLINWLLELSEAEIRNRMASGNLPERVRKHNLLGTKAGNSVFEWLTDECIFDPLPKTQMGRLDIVGTTAEKLLYPSYCRWCSGTGRKPKAQNTFGDELINTAADIGHVLTRERDSVTRRTFVSGLKLRDPPEINR